MKTTTRLLSFLFLLSAISCNSGPGNSSVDAGRKDPGKERDYIQLKIYTYDTVAQENLLDDYFENAYLPALHRAGVGDVGVFKPIEGLNGDQKYIMVLLKLRSLEQLEQVPVSLASDADYLASGKAYIDAPFNEPPCNRIESFLLKAMEANPHLVKPEFTTDRSQRVYELRSYQSATEKLYGLKVEMFNEGESDLFHQLEFNPVFFAEVLSSAYMPHLMYMITFSDTVSQREHWDTFIASAGWQEMSQLDRYQNTVSHITRYQMYPTSYSDF